MASMETAKIRVRHGNSEFEAEGPPELVKAQYEKFLETLKTQPELLASEPNSLSAVPSIATSSATSDRESPSGPLIHSDHLDQIFQLRGKMVSLLALPKSEKSAPDAMIMLLYGFETLTDTAAVTGVTLAAAARQSGVQIGRVDTVMNGLTEFVNAGGARRGRRYSLNNRGRKRAEELIISLTA